MKINLFSLALVIFIVSILPQDSHPCTTFCTDKDNQLVIEKNFDYFKHLLAII